MAWFTDALRDAARTDGAKTALISGGAEIGYGALDEQAERVAAALHKLGIRKGDRVAFTIGNHPPFLAVHHGILRIGAVSVPISTRMRAAELRPYINRVKPRAIIADEAITNEVMTAGPHSAPVFVIGSHPSARPFDEALTDSAAPQVDVSGDDLAMICFTSGASGEPRAVRLTHDNLSTNLDQMTSLEGAVPKRSDVVLCVLPLYSLFALNVVAGTTLRAGATLLLGDGFDPRSSLEDARRGGATIMVGVPQMFESWLSAGSGELPGVRFALSAGAPLSAKTARGFEERFGVPVLEGYGLTEAGPSISASSLGERRDGSVGKPLPGQEMTIVDASGESVMLGDIGEIWVKGPNVTPGYWDDDELTAATIRDGWLRTGDAGYQDEDGFLWLAGRMSDVINVSGFSVYPWEVERALTSHPAVADAVAVGEPDDRHIERVKAFVVLEQGRRAGEDELVVHCTRSLARFKVPSEIVFVESIPRVETGRAVRRLMGSKSEGA